VAGGEVLPERLGHPLVVPRPGLGVAGHRRARARRAHVGLVRHCRAWVIVALPVVVLGLAGLVAGAAVGGVSEPRRLGEEAAGDEVTRHPRPSTWAGLELGSTKLEHCHQSSLGN